MEKKFLRVICIACIVLGAAELLGTFAAWLLTWVFTAPSFPVGQAASVGIIGGADGPTAIFIAGPAWTAYLLPAAILALGIFGLQKLKKRKDGA